MSIEKSALETYNFKIKMCRFLAFQNTEEMVWTRWLSETNIPGVIVVIYAIGADTIFCLYALFRLNIMYI